MQPNLITPGDAQDRLGADPLVDVQGDGIDLEPAPPVLLLLLRALGMSGTCPSAAIFAGGMFVRLSSWR